MRAEAVTLGVLTGTQSRERLKTANPADVILSVAHIMSYLSERELLRIAVYEGSPEISFRAIPVNAFFCFVIN